jgi:hypothetical protein
MPVTATSRAAAAAGSLLQAGPHVAVGVGRQAWHVHRLYLARMQTILIHRLELLYLR